MAKNIQPTQTCIERYFQIEKDDNGTTFFIGDVKLPFFFNLKQKKAFCKSESLFL